MTERNRRKTGSEYEKKAAEFLERQGLTVLFRNFRCRRGEIDLILRDGPAIVFAEVKYRSGSGSGSALEAVDERKQRRISAAARYYLATRTGNMEIPCRFDVVAFDGERIRWVRNAFAYREQRGLS